ncbi:diphthine synthase [Coemansia sp. RSA 1721]|nr:diphthine synthase [Coemansia sp. RSA 1721]
MLYIVGLGLSDERDITVKGLEAVKGSERVYLEAYTSILMVPKERLEAFYGKEVIVAHRETVESNSDDILRDADKIDVSLLVVGDPYGATTHSDLVIRAHELNIPVKTIHNASIMNAVGSTGLQLYSFGQTISMVFFTETWRPDSFYDRINENAKIGLHTLCLLDIKVREQSIENMMRNRPIYEPPRYMTVNQAVEQLLEVEEKRQEKAYTEDTIAVGVSRLGSDDQVIKAGTLKQLLTVDFGKPLHSLVLVGSRLHLLEAEILRENAVDLDALNLVLKRDYGIDNRLSSLRQKSPCKCAIRTYAQRLHADDSILQVQWKNQLYSWKTLGLCAIPLIALGLGVWQTQRLKWKLSLLDEVNDRMHRRPIALPMKITPDEINRNEYRRVIVHGVFDHSREMLVGPRSYETEPGFLVITPLVREDGSRVLVNRGWIKRELKDPKDRPESQNTDPVTVVAFVRKPPTKNSFVPDSDPEKGLWYCIDVEPMARYSGSQEVLLETIESDSVAATIHSIKNGVPLGVPQQVDIRNNHLQYLITWYSLAAITGGMLFFRLRKPKTSASTVRRMRSRAGKMLQ